MACKWPSCCKLSFKSTFFYQNTTILSVNFVSILFCSFFYVKCILFQFLTRAKVMHIPILTGAQNRSINRRKKQSYFVKKCSFLKLCFRDESHLYADCLFHILTIYPKCLLLQFFSRCIRMHIPVLTGVQNGRISQPNTSPFLLKKMIFLKLVCQLLVLYSLF